MKKLLAGLLFLFFTFNFQAQWYTKYCVNDMNDLTEFQLTKALQKANRNIWIGGAIAAVGTTMMVQSIIELSSSNDDDLLDSFGSSIGGTIGIVVSLIPLAVGIPLLVANANRKTSIKMALTKFNTTSDIGNRQSSNWGYQPTAAVGLSLTISF